MSNEMIKFSFVDIIQNEKFQTKCKDVLKTSDSPFRDKSKQMFDCLEKIYNDLSNDDQSEGFNADFEINIKKGKKTQKKLLTNQTMKILQDHIDKEFHINELPEDKDEEI